MHSRHESLKSLGQKPQKKIIAPFKIIRYSPSLESQVVVSSRIEIKKKIDIKGSMTHRRKANLSDTQVLKDLSFENFVYKSPTNVFENTSNQNNWIRMKQLSWKNSSLRHTQMVNSPISLIKIRKSSSIISKDSIKPSKKFLVPFLTKFISTEISHIPYFNMNLAKKEEPNKESPRLNQFSKPSIAIFDTKCTGGSMPNSREGCQVAIVAEKMYLYAGESRILHPDVRELDLISWKWNILNTQYCPQGRAGHSMVVFKKKIVVFGGYASHTHDGTRRCTAKLNILSLKDQKWQIFTGSGQLPQALRNHAASKVGRFMVVYGGMNQRGHTTNCLYIYDSKAKEWSIPEINVFDDPGFRSHATLTGIFSNEQLLDYRSNLFEIQAKNPFQISNVGFYLFGGLNFEYKPCNWFHCLHIVNDSLNWIEIKSENAPSPRYSHSACTANYRLYIFGGRNDDLYGQGGSELNDLHMFNVENLKWERVDIKGSEPEGRWGHCMASYGSKLLVLGGMTHKNFISSQLCYFETNADVVEEVLSRNKNGK
ncbi:unnamed protein product [Blepharisma stoltei]|uniref:Kelch repeat-containing protein n=1 Tax=Blepharisma stoltei TaxID=1481888 RepID=A0AAU9JUQ0_9CILI|nr:unnamed protein product [Blepharisma stoltei]